MQDAIEARLASAGYLHYETSAFARTRPAVPAQPQLLAFRRLPGDRRRRARQADAARPRPAPDALEAARAVPGQVAAGTPVQEEFAVAAADLPFEFMLNALRLIEGFDAQLFESRTSLPLLSIENSCARPKRGPDRAPAATHCATDRGRRFLNQLLQRFLVDRGDRRQPAATKGYGCIASTA
jgi:coproporphyrinogen III oxidase-like Fe-S oxidoreductase